jgi:hypothetical protein
MRKGIHVRLHLDKALDVRALRGSSDYDVHVIDGIGRGSFRVTMHGIVAVTGILGATAVTSMFAYFRKEEALECLEHVFGGVRAAYETGVESMR